MGHPTTAERALARRPTLVWTAVGVAALAAAYGAAQWHVAGRVPAGTTVVGADVGGEHRQSARSRGIRETGPVTELLVLGVAALVVIAAATVAGPRLGIASPLVLVLIGVGASLLPVFGGVHIDPEWVLEGVLPPLLYSSAVSMPAMNFRREFGAISGLSVVLVVATSLVLGLFFQRAIPDLGFAWGVALGAIISPTDAVATSIVKQGNVSKRVVAMLDGESLLNDATALVLLRTTIVATAAAFSFWGALGTFAWSVLVAVVIGGAVGWANLAVRRRVTDSAVNTVISFAVPFVAAVPATLLGGSGLVAAVVAGLMTGIRAPRLLSPRNRLSDAETWRTVELLLEGLVFLTMGLQVKGVIDAVGQGHGIGSLVLVAVGALVLTILVRAAYVAPLLRSLGRRARRGAGRQERMQDLAEKLATPEGQQHALVRARGSQRRVEAITSRVRQAIADIDYFRRQPLGWREGTTVVWAGLRGAVTVAAAQTLPADTPRRAELVLVAFTVAMLSLLVQGGTIGPLLRRVAPPVDPVAGAAQDDEERTRIMELLAISAQGVPSPGPVAADDAHEAFAASRAHRLAVLDAQRAALLDARDHGTFDADILEDALMNLDASQLAIELRGKLAG